MSEGAGQQARRGFSAGADRATVVARAGEMLLAGETIDVRRLAEECGVGRTTVYRWFGSRSGLLGEALWTLVDGAWSHARRTSPGTGPLHVRQVVATFLTSVRDSPPASSLMVGEPRLAVVSIMSPTGFVQRRAVARTEQLLHDHSHLPVDEVRAVAEIMTQVAMTYVWAQLLTGASADLATPLAIIDRLLRQTR
ncbi:QsdR family transcriptional regulator [Nocardioides sp. 503]|uniref:TetR/AcrR family transcriptional regulator n=1 Tax=Nocardioides sp. 503 TaxID=2508326 RepID=UPI00106FE7D6|nr:QsdR family transcriptional regulator [Nocardioides sp. 503]